MVASSTNTITPCSCSAGPTNFEAIAIVHRLLLLLAMGLLLSSHSRTTGVVFQSRNGVGRRRRFIPIMTG